MTCFVVSHNLQVAADNVPAIAPQDLATGLSAHAPSVTKAEALQHPHWLILLVSELPPAELAQELVQAWRSYRQTLGHGDGHELVALGGRKDSTGAPGSPLQQGAWGVDVVETVDTDGFLRTINWQGLLSARPADGVFEIRG